MIPMPPTAIAATIALAAATLGASSQTAMPPPSCSRCGWRPPTPTRTIRVATTPQLHRAVEGAGADTTILLDPGDYQLDRTLDFHQRGITIRGAQADAARVTLRGAGMRERRVGVALSISAPDITIADLTVGFVGFHAIQVRGERGASRVVVHNVRLVDTGEQLFKGSTDGGPRHADAGLVACSTFEYTDHAPSDYTNGVDVLAGSDWVVRDSTFRRIRGPHAGNYTAGPAILFWANSQRTLIERNVVIDSARGIALGLGPSAGRKGARHSERRYDHQEGWIRNNVIVNLHPWADEGIEVNAARDVRIEHNTVLTEGLLPWSISLRFPSTTAHARNNLTTRAIQLRDGGTGVLEGNMSGARPDWFVDAAAADVRPAGGDLPLVDAGVPIVDLTEDMMRRSRVRGAAPDAGAHER